MSECNYLVTNASIIDNLM